ncbi:hypothetical protein L2E82_02910 [Cichorium intybus]|uniref:Uncharacterized protein n=1 Tax=Cichorium intybus TaxID=13427 RepID=A0ACB9H455_CICIN|nr:hypothetical protein L2E82_02910 [Cichorium intybus]
MWASTCKKTLKYKMTIVVSALGECQENMSTGYLSAFPSEFHDRFEAVQPVWAPYYTIHKIMAGLVDQGSILLESKQGIDINRGLILLEPDAFDDEGGVNQEKRFSIAMERYRDSKDGDKMNPFAEQEAWEDHHIGPNGARKTTTINCLTGITPATEGDGIN